MMDAHIKNVEKTSFGGKFDPYAGLSSSGIAGTEPDKDKEEEDGKTGGTAPATPGSSDVEMKDASKKDEGKFDLICHLFFHLLYFQCFKRFQFACLCVSFHHFYGCYPFISLLCFVMLACGVLFNPLTIIKRKIKEPINRSLKHHLPKKVINRLILIL